MACALKAGVQIPETEEVHFAPFADDYSSPKRR